MKQIRLKDESTEYDWVVELTPSGGHGIGLGVRQHPDDVATAYDLTPSFARELATALNRAADEAEAS